MNGVSILEEKAHITLFTTPSTWIEGESINQLEEAPQAYKDIESVIWDMVSFGLISVVAEFEPVLTYKVRKNVT